MVSGELYDHLNTTKKVIELLSPVIEAGCDLFTITLKSGNKILFAVTRATRAMLSIWRQNYAAVL